MPDADVFENAYGRLAATRVTVSPAATRSSRPAPGARGETPRSRLLPRLALLGPGEGVLRVRE